MKRFITAIQFSVVASCLLFAQANAQVCPETHSAQLYKVQKVGWYNRNGVDMAASTIDQNSYVVVRSLGTVPFTMMNERNLYYYQHDTENHDLIQQGLINDDTMPVNRIPRIDNLNFLGFLGGWSVAWNALYYGMGFSDLPKIQTRNFSDNMTPMSNQQSLFQNGVYTMYDSLDVAALPGLGKAVVIGTMKSLPGLGAWPTYLQYVEVDGSLGPRIMLTGAGGYGTGDRSPAVASGLTYDDDSVVAAWISSVDGFVRYQIFDSAGIALTEILTGPAAREIAIGAVPGGFAIARVEQTTLTSRTVKLNTYDWDGTPLNQISVATGPTIVNPDISAAMYPVNGHLQPIFAVTYTDNWYASNTSMTARYLSMTRGLSTVTMVLQPTSLQTVSGQMFYEPNLTTEYRNSVRLFTGCDNKLVAGVFWNQNVTSGSDTYIATYKAFFGVSGVYSMSASSYGFSPLAETSNTVQFDRYAFDELDSNTDVEAFLSIKGISSGTSVSQSSTLLDSSLNERVPGLPECYDYLIGSCVDE